MFLTSCSPRNGNNEKQLYGVRNWGEFVEDAQQVDNSDSESESSTIEE
jgi:hypothetical protein